MSADAPRLRMFAGPNGSGKTTVKGELPDRLFGNYINPDDIEKTLRAGGALDLTSFGRNPSGSRSGIGWQRG